MLISQNAPAVSTIAGPAGISRLNDSTKPPNDAAHASATAMRTWPASESDQWRCGDCGQHHQTNRHQSAKGDKARDNAQHNERQEDQVPPPALAAGRRHEAGSKLSSTSGRQINASTGRVTLATPAIPSIAASSTASTLPNSRWVRSMLCCAEISATPAASASRYMPASWLSSRPPVRRASQPGDDRDRKAGGDPPQPHRPERQTRQRRAQTDSRQYAMLEHVAHQAHAAQHEEDAERRGRDRQRQAPGQGTPHEAEGERRDQDIVHLCRLSPRSLSRGIPGSSRPWLSD